MKTYRVEWAIDVEAKDARQAALIALSIQRDHESIATVFDVIEFDGNGEGIQIDLGEVAAAL